MKGLFKIFLVFLFFVGVSLVTTAPLYKYLDKGFAYTSAPTPGNEVVPFKEGDPVQLYYHFWMAWDYLSGGPGPFFRDPYEFKTGGESVGVFTTRRLLISLLFVLMAPFGTVFAFNALILLSITLSGFMAFLLARLYTDRIIPSILAGIIYSCFPFALAQILGGHTNGFVLFLVPFILWCFEKGFSTGKKRYFYFSTLGYACFAFIEYHLLYYICLLTPPFFLVRMATIRPGWKRFFEFAVALSVAMGIGVFIMLFIKHVEISGSIREGGVSLREINLYTPTWQQLFFRIDRGMEKFIYLGFIPLGGALISFLIFGLRRPLFWLYAGILGVFGLLCLGPSIDQTIPIYRFLYDHLPYFSLSRLPGRMIVFVALATAILIALGCARMKKGSLIAFIMLVILAIDYFPRSAVGITLLPPKSKVYEFVKENSGDKNLFCLPIWPGDTSWSSIYLYYVTQSKVPIVNGYYPIVPKNYIEEVFYPLYSVNVGELRQDQAELLKQLNVKYVVFHEEAFPGKVSHFPARITIEQLLNNPHLRFVLKDGKHWLFELLDQPRILKQKRVSTPIGIYLMGNKLRSNAENAVYHRIQILPPGKYASRFHFKGEGAKGVRIKLLGNDPLKRANRDYVDLELLSAGVGKSGVVVLPFVLEKGQLVTIQVEKPKKGKLDLESIIITQANRTNPLFEIEAEKLFTHGLIVEDAEASNGQAVLGMPQDLEQVELLYGPYRSYPAGHYRLQFWVKPTKLKKEDPLLCADLQIADLEVSTNYGRTLLAKKPLYSSDLFQVEDYHPVEVSFSLDKDEVLEFRVPYYRKTGFYIDRIEIKKQ